ncbi:endo-1,4-beta-xylanase [Streptomyces litchfieldiae]|uniref:Beta-xylanase n=1 Tax=Streptomyces litchfieldiae TaxID=3075543 RepID=A0ABU2MVW4_9ACTN|nr:endo-1,4-beta-xylanase [Streptomyces sp. DSM 44938]MDT0345239.1 endo-1,4-beta-xylanase [Streptomyces sp. DSM 44938]
MRRAAVVVAAGALLSGAVMHGSAQAQDVSAQAATLREAADAKGKFIGTAVADHRLSDSRYNNIAANEFNSVTAENVMKWDSIQPSRGSFNFAAGDRLVDFAQANGQQVYGHTLVWHSQLPSWVSNGGFNATELNTIMTTHITEVMNHYEGDVEYWDVVNEVFNEDGTLRQSVFQQTIGQSYIANAFRAADAADPNAKLCINDYNVEGDNAKSDGLYNLVQSLLGQGVPIDCVGLQSHFILDQIPSTLQANMQRFAALGLEVNITELDIRINMPADSAELQRQATQFGNVVSACLAVSACQGVTVWGFGDADSWVPGVFPGQGAACLYDDNYNAKPSYNGVLTALGGTTDPDPDPDPDPVEGCLASYQVTSRWNAGSVVQVGVTVDEAVSGWTVTFSLPAGESVTSSWNTQLTQSGTTVTARNASYNGSIPAGGSLSFGFQTNSGAVYSAPVVSLNGAACEAA